MRRWLLPSWLLVAGCDGSLADGSYHGEPLLQVSGEVRLVDKSGGEAVFPAGQLRLALMWLGGKGTASDALFMTAVEQSVSLVAVFPARFGLAAYTPPPDAALLNDDPAGPYALAVLAAYVDTDGNGAFDRDVDELVGGSTGQRVILYAPQSFAPAWVDQPLSAGYHRMAVQVGGGACKKLGRLALTQDNLAETEVKVFAEMPANLFPDVNCDGTSGAFTAACPSPNKVAIDCAKGKADPYICAHCPKS